MAKLKTEAMRREGCGMTIGANGAIMLGIVLGLFMGSFLQLVTTIRKVNKY